MIRQLDAVHPVTLPDDADAPVPAIRQVTRQVALGADGWSTGRARKIEELFDGLAAEWNERWSEERLLPLRDALERGGPFGGRAAEIGAGTCFHTAVIEDSFDSVVAVDLSAEMLIRAPQGVARARADASSLPCPDDAFDAVVLVNMLLFPAETARVLAPGGALVWVNSLGERTPIHLPAADVVEAMGPGWSGAASRAGAGTWCVLRRD